MDALIWKIQNLMRLLPEYLHIVRKENLEKYGYIGFGLACKRNNIKLEERPDEYVCIPNPDSVEELVYQNILYSSEHMQYTSVENNMLLGVTFRDPKPLECWREVSVNNTVIPWLQAEILNILLGNSWKDYTVEYLSLLDATDMFITYQILLLRPAQCEKLI